MNDRELELRLRIMRAFAETGEPPPGHELDPGLLDALEKAHLVLLDEAGSLRMAFPFGAHDDGATVTAADGRSWRANCPWDAFGAAAALGLDAFTVECDGVTATEAALFHVEVPADRWWADIAYA